MARFMHPHKAKHRNATDDTDGFETLDYPPHLRSSVCLDNSSDESRSLEHVSLSKSVFTTYFDHDGRLLGEHPLRRAVFKGGVDPDIRKEVWQFLFELFPFHSTKSERDMMLVDYHLKYAELKNRLNEHFKPENFPDPEDAEILAPSYLARVPATSGDESLRLLKTKIGEQQFECLTIQAKVFGGRMSIDIKSLIPFIRIIDKDVPRTDRELEYFSGPSNPHTRMLRDVLLTYAAANPKLGYTQGMNDIAARFLVVMDNEVETYWCFSNFMKHIQDNFVEDGLLNKLRHVQFLLAELDPDLHEYLEFLDVIDLTFCHRWMLLNFKREFDLANGLRCFEIISSHHLELSSLEAQKAREKQKRKDFAQQGGTNQLAGPVMNLDFTFDVFMCTTILIMKRGLLFKCKDASDVFQLICGLNAKLDLDLILSKAEVLFFKYCSKSVTECFTLLD